MEANKKAFDLIVHGIEVEGDPVLHGGKEKTVATRVVQGGHDVPEAIIRRRFEAGIRNFNKIYKSLVDAWILYDNSGEAPNMLEQGGNA
ncbi:MAG: hypothetical protein KAT52_08060 [Desulfobacterales bacterium]|nr:hypothetical protein [Desulfobacterales bacterium]